MTTQNWIMIAPVLAMLGVAILLIPVILRAHKKYAKMAADIRRQEASQKRSKLKNGKTRKAK
ncbi:hypothetical protein J4377_09715 [Halomonas sp. XH26]|uniref:hypothetical protein n=1 Tax=Halomonas sp. XH26 TaxID=2557993 RepID=UPI00209FFB07|nr:hypothetical protein [Halomonas sp. XH26]UTA78265.1 hypothetical protein J4377_09715 [Halomonas sp. XH26]